VLAIIGIVLFITVLWPESGTSDRAAALSTAPTSPPQRSPSSPSAPDAALPPPEVNPPAAESTTAAAAPPEPTQAAAPAAKPEPAERAQSAPPTAPPASVAAAEPAQTASVPASASPDVKSMVDAAIAGDDAQVQSFAKKLAAQRATRGDRSRARELNGKALAQMRGGRYADAVPLFEAAHGADPGDPEIRENLGYALLKAERIEEAERALLSALEIGPQRASAWGSLGFVYAKRGQQAEAVRLMLTAYRFAPDRKKAADIYRRQAQSDADPKVRAALEGVLKQLPR
jgi:Flp pilus assembly protein TadD